MINEAYEDDYAFLIQGLLDLYEACFNEQLIKLTSDLQKEMDYRFWDAENNGSYHQTVEDPHIIIRIINGWFISNFFPYISPLLMEKIIIIMNFNFKYI